MGEQGVGSRREVALFSTALKSLGDRPAARDVLELAADPRFAIDSTQPCMRPGCHNTCEWGGRGRPRMFCSDQCRRQYDRTRAELLRQVATLERLSIVFHELDRRKAVAELAKRRWVLTRYPALGVALGESTGEDQPH